MKVWGEVWAVPPSRLIVPAALPVRVTAPTDALQVVLTIAVAARVTAAGLVRV